MRIRTLLLLICLISPILVLYVPVAQAQEQSFSKTQAYLLHGPTPYVDGKTTLHYYFALINKDGSAYTGFKGEASLSSGDKGKLEELERGLYHFEITPAAIPERKTIRLSIKGNGDNGKISQGWDVLWLPYVTGNLTIRSNTKTLLLTKGASAPLEIEFQGTEPEKADLIFKVTTGKVDQVKSLGKGKYSAVFRTNPKKRYPQFALISVADARNPEEIYATTVISLAKKIKLPVKSIPNAEVTMELLGKKYGPTKSTSNGKATFSLTVPPGVSMATLTATAKGKTRTDEIDLNIPSQ
ncbi:MAG: hypothetical protein VX278_20075, partial [Myxococcota bacterium]|nr:hypothetical protein [Myxococcota bacterium]